MSQVYLPGSTALPVTVPTSFPTDSGTAIPEANVLSIVGGTSTDDNPNGIKTAGAGAVVTALLTNRQVGSGNVTGAITGDLITFACGGTAGVYTFTVSVSGFAASLAVGCGYQIVGSVITDGGAATLIGTPDKIVNEAVALNLADMNLVVSDNNAIVRAKSVIGVKISYGATLTYTFTADIA